MPRFFAGVDELRPLLGQEVAVSPWISVEQARIQHFADAIEDPQWIHVDVERARKESPYGVPIAHGFLTLSLLSHLSALAFEIGGCRMKINYGLNRVRFPQAVPAGGRIRARFTLKGAHHRGGRRTAPLGRHRGTGGRPQARPVRRMADSRVPGLTSRRPPPRFAAILKSWGHILRP